MPAYSAWPYRKDPKLSLLLAMCFETRGDEDRDDEVPLEYGAGVSSADLKRRNVAAQLAAAGRGGGGEKEEGEGAAEVAGAGAGAGVAEVAPPDDSGEASTDGQQSDAGDGDGGVITDAAPGPPAPGLRAPRLSAPRLSAPRLTTPPRLTAPRLSVPNLTIASAAPEEAPSPPIAPTPDDKVGQCRLKPAETRVESALLL